MTAIENAQREKQIDVHLVVRREDERWSAVAVDYTIVGQGTTPDEAVEAAMDAVVSYLRWCHDDGMTLDEARRPIPGRWRLEIEAQRLIGRLRETLHRPSSMLDKHVAAPVAYSC